MCRILCVNLGVLHTKYKHSSVIQLLCLISFTVVSNPVCKPWSDTQFYEDQPTEVTCEVTAQGEHIPQVKAKHSTALHSTRRTYTHSTVQQRTGRTKKDN